MYNPNTIQFPNKTNLKPVSQPNKSRTGIQTKLIPNQFPNQAIIKSVCYLCKFCVVDEWVPGYVIDWLINCQFADSWTVTSVTTGMYILEAIVSCYPATKKNHWEMFVKIIHFPLVKLQILRALSFPKCNLLQILF